MATLTVRRKLRGLGFGAKFKSWWISQDTAKGIMIRLVRRLLKKYPLAYTVAARCYHNIYQAAMRVKMVLRGVKYLAPTKKAPPYFSQYGQDYYLSMLHLVSPNGFFLEVGCNHPKINSNTHYLEHEMNFKGISIDAIDYSNEFSSERPNTRFIRALVDVEQGESDFYQVKNVVGWEHQVSSMHKEALDFGKGFEADVVRIKTIPLREVIEENQEIDILLIDVEGHEFSVLDSLDWAQTKPKVILIENNGDFYPRKKLEDHISRKGYKLLARIGTFDDIYILA